MNAQVQPFDWYMEIPPVTRAYFTAAFTLTAACALDVVSPFSLYFNPRLVFQGGEIWRLLTNFMFFGSLGFEFIFHMYFMIRYSQLLENGSFRNRPSDFVWFLVFGALVMMGIAPYVNIHFFGSSLTFMMVYLWGRRNPAERLSFLWIFSFTAPYLPWVLLGFSMLLGHPVDVDVIGILAGHFYFFLKDVYPAVAKARGWKIQDIFPTPSILKYICGDSMDGDAPRFNIVNAEQRR